MNMSCEDCEHYIPHSVYRYIGFCEKQGKVVFNETPTDCDTVNKMAMDDLSLVFESTGWIYCIDCKAPIFEMEEAVKHISNHHLIATRFMYDRVAAEEVGAVS